MIIVKFNDTLKGREWYTSFNASCSAGDIFYKMSFNFYAKTVSLHATRFFSFLDLLQLLYNFLEFTHTHNREKLSVSWTWLVVVKRGTRLRIIFQIILILILISRNRKLCVITYDKFIIFISLSKQVSIERILQQRYFCSLSKYNYSPTTFKIFKLGKRYDVMTLNCLVSIPFEITNICIFVYCILFFI